MQRSKIKLTLRLVLGAVILGTCAGMLANWIGTPESPTELAVFGLAFVVALLAYVALELSDRGDKPQESQAQRHRRQMIKQVRGTWINQVLMHSLYQTARIELGFEVHQTAVDHPWDMVLRQTENPSRVLPPGTRISDIYDQLGEELLILGQPGSGKTTMLLELTRDLLDRAEVDKGHPLPVVFNLSSWGADQPPLDAWLATELNVRYGVPKKLAKEWVREERFLPLLDGLDEVALARRAACVKAINTFRTHHGLLPVVVCSRVADYEALAVQLRLQGAVEIQPLTETQVDRLLEDAGPSLLGVQKALKTNATLKKLLDTPLMLSVAVLAYQGPSSEALQAAESRTDRRAQLFQTYVQRMLECYQSRYTARYSRQQILRWLAWLGRQMDSRAQSIFYLERMQPDWLSSERLAISTSLMIGGLVVRLVVGLVVGLLFGLVVGLFFGLLFGLVGGLVVGLLLFSNKIEPAETMKWSWRNLDLKEILFFGLVGGLVGGLLDGLVGGLVVGLVGGLNAVIQHYALRGLLAFKKLTPWRYVRFLNQAVDLLLLRRVGGGYIFVHRMLLEWFAGLTRDDIERISQTTR